MKLPGTYEASKWLLETLAAFGSKITTSKAIKPQELDRADKEMLMRNMLVELALEDSGKKETNGRNRSALIDEVNRKMMVPMGSPYCLTALYFRVIDPLCDSLQLSNTVWMTASTQEFWEKSYDKYKIPKGESAKKGDIGILQDIKKPRLGHAYLHIEDEDQGNQKTFEYNTNLKGSTEGDGNYIYKRTQEGTLTKRYLGSVDVVSWLLDTNER